MAGTKLSENIRRKMLDAMKRHRREDGSYNKTAIARELGEPRGTIQHRLKKLKDTPIPRFESPNLPHRNRTIDELIADRIKESERVIGADEARDLIPIRLNIDGPFGLMIFGDCHLDDPGCDFGLLKEHVELASSHPYILAGGIGDYTNSWIGRLARLYADQSVTAQEAWILCEWFIKSVKWLFLVAGNHDCWQGASDPIQWFVKQNQSMYEPHGIRLELQHPGPGNIRTRIHARHNFSGTSIYNALHGPKRELLMGFRDHIVVAGHLHTGGDERTIAPDGICAQLIRVSGYKAVADSYARQLGLRKMPMHPSALVIIDPREPETSPARAFCAPTVEIGVKILDMIRSDYEISIRKSAIVKTPSRKARG